jgi:hypothetical protein
MQIDKGERDESSSSLPSIKWKENIFLTGMVKCSRRSEDEFYEFAKSKFSILKIFFSSKDNSFARVPDLT